MTRSEIIATRLTSLTLVVSTGSMASKTAAGSAASSATDTDKAADGLLSIGSAGQIGVALMLST